MPWEPPPSSPAPTDEPPPAAGPAAAPPPRAFAQGTGVVLQTAGVLLFFASCLGCLTLAGPQLETGQVPQHLASLHADRPDPAQLFEHPDRWGLALTVAAMTIGGVALAAFGLGLQSDKPRASIGALVSSVLTALALLVAAIALWSAPASIAGRCLNHGALLVVMVLTLFCVGARAGVLKDPPPPDLETLPPDWEPPRRMH